MRNWKILHVVLAALLLGGVFPTPIARADVRTEARIAFRTGMELVQEGKIDEGVAKLQEAFDILPHPNVLYNIGRAYAEAGRYEEARDYFEQYLAADPPDREEVEGFIAAIDARVAANSRSAEREAAVEAAPEEENSSSVVASDDEIQAIEDSAVQIAALAEATQSESLRQRAERLREVAAQLRDPNATGAGDRGTTEGPDGANAGTDSVNGQASAGTTETTDLSSGRLELTGASTEGLYDEQVVSASRFAQSPLDAPNATYNITAQDIRLTGLTMIGDLIRRVPGADVMTVGGPNDINVSMRGFNQPFSNKMLVLIDGRSVYVDTLGTVFWLNQPYNVEDIDRIEVIRGPASALYGADAFAGIINILTKPPGLEENEVTAGVGTDGWFRAAGRSSGRVGKLGYRLSAGMSRQDHFTYRISDDRRDYEISNFIDELERSYDQLQAEGSLRYRFSEDIQGTVSAGVIDNIQSQVATSPFEESVSRGPTSHIMGLVETKWGQVRAFWNRIDAEVASVNTPTTGKDRLASAFVQDIFDVEADFAQEFDLLVPHNFHLGGGYRQKRIKWNFLDDKHTEHHFSAFIQDTLKLADPLTLVASLRSDLHPLLDKPVVSPRGALIFRPTEGSAIRASFGTAFRTPTFLESYSDTTVGTPLQGVVVRVEGSEPAGLELKPESILSAELGYRWAESDFFDADLSTYYNRITNIIGVQPIDFFEVSQSAGGGDYIEGESAFPLGSLTFVNTPSTYDVVGAELATRIYPVRGLDIYANYAYNKTSVKDPDLSAGEDQDQRTSQHKVNLGAQYRTTFGLDVGLDAHWVSDQVWVERQFDNEGNVVPAIYELPSYYMLNGRVGYRMFDDSLELGLHAYNLTNNRHRQHPRGEVLHARVLGSATYRF